MSRRLYILLSSFLFYQIRDLQAQWKVRDLVLGLRQKWHSEDILSRFFLILQGGGPKVWISALIFDPSRLWVVLIWKPINTSKN